MQLPAMRGVIERRILANYRLDPDVAARALPAPFRPKLQNGYSIAGICLIRLAGIRPAALPGSCGMGSENAAHRFAVEWDVDGVTREGVYIPRRDTDSRLNALFGGWIFPGHHHRARFDVVESEQALSVALTSDDGQTHVRVAGRTTEAWPAGSAFALTADASAFFRRGSLGYSATPAGDQFDGLELACDRWDVTPLAVDAIESSFFDDPERFPAGSIAFDCALLMRNIPHVWHSRSPLCCEMA
jgi:hypothetical protein